MISTFNVRQEYVGNGTLASYTFDFKLATLAHLKVIVANASFVETFRVLGTDVTYLSSVTFDATAGGGTVVLASNLPSGHHLYLLLANDQPLQESEFKNKTDFTLSRFESVLDVIARALQRVAYLSKRSLKIPETVLNSTSFDGELPTLTANTLLAVNTGGTGFMMGPTVPDLAANVAAAQASEDAALVSANAAAVSASASDASADLAQEWATKTTALVEATDNSAKAYAIGGTGAGQPTGGDAKSWATKTTGIVSGTDYSAKEWARGTNVRSQASGGSAKDWATYMSGTVDDTERSAKYYAASSATWAANSEASANDSEASAAAALASEVAAAASAMAFLYSTITAAGAYAPTTAAHRFVLFDATLGNQSLTLPAINAGNNGLTFSIKKKDSTANTVTITGTVEGEVNPVIDYQYTGRTVVAIEGAWYWKY